jgi:arsenite methyltransferase
MAQELKLDLAQLRQAIQHEYQEVAQQPDKGFHFHVGRPLAEKLGYSMEEVDQLPPSVVESFAGVGNPFALGSLNKGDVVADLGSGAGFDAILAMRQVGPTGRVIGIDMTPAMLEKARANAEAAGHNQVEFRQGYLEDLPIADNSVDVVISNGVFNLTPVKEQAFAEAFRILKPGGRMQIADILVEKEVPEDARNEVHLWTG